MNELLKIVISTEGEEILVHRKKDNELLVMLFPEYRPYEYIPQNSIRYRKNLHKYDSRNIWKI